MNWADFYFLCFVIGFALSLVSFLAGVFDLHIPGLEHHGHVHVNHVAHTHVLGGQADLPGISPFNMSSAMAFLCWFGGAGYLLTTVWKVWSVAALLLSSAAGLFGGMVVFLFLAKVLMRRDHSMHDSDYDPIGVLGRVSISIRPGGTGEIVFAQEGVRQTCAARCEDAASVPKGTEVVITRYEKGVAYVRRWDELAEEPVESGERSQN